MTTRIFMTRHGESEWKHSHRYTGRQDVPLGELGKEQAHRVGERLKGEGLSSIYTSPLRRASDTAVALASSAKAPIVMEPG